MLIVEYPIAKFCGNISYNFAIFHELRRFVRKPDYVNCNESIKCGYPLINISDLLRRLTGLKSCAPELGVEVLIDMEYRSVLGATETRRPKSKYSFAQTLALILSVTPPPSSRARLEKTSFSELSKLEEAPEELGSFVPAEGDVMSAS